MLPTIYNRSEGVIKPRLAGVPCFWILKISPQPPPNTIMGSKLASRTDKRAREPFQ